jgi:hypothetical protein
LDLSRTKLSGPRQGIPFPRTRISLCSAPLLVCQLLSINPGIIVGHLHSDIASVFALEVQLMPQVILTATGDDDIVEIDPSLTDEISFLVVVENGALHPIVVGSVVYNEPEFLIPGSCQPCPNNITGCSGNLPSRSLASSSICIGLLGLFP